MDRHKRGRKAAGRALLSLAALLCAALPAGCGGIPQEQYDAVCAERDALRGQLAQVQEDLRALEGGLDAAPEAPARVNITGEFTATVRELIPDYTLDAETPNVAVLTQFQDGPFTVFVGELAAELEVGKTYNFAIVPEEDVEIAPEDYAAGVPSPEVAVPLYRLRIAGASLAGEEDMGLAGRSLQWEPAP